MTQEEKTKIEEKIVDVLKTVYDPEIPVNIWDLGMIYKIDFDTEDNRLFIVESHRPVYTPKQYRNWFGQLLEHSPLCERDIRRPEQLETHDEKGEF